ncbi:MAG: hypothetical protein AAF351_13160 [Pseudomonadota bacterium]
MKILWRILGGLLVIALFFLAKPTLTMWAYSGDGKFRVEGIPPLTNHRIEFGKIDLTQSGTYTFTFRGYSSHTYSLLVLAIPGVTDSQLAASATCVRATITSKNMASPVIDHQECLRDQARRNPQLADETRYVPLFLHGSYRNLQLSWWKRYELEIQVTDGDPNLSRLRTDVDLFSGWK